jgi:hypothetical protein
MNTRPPSRASAVAVDSPIPVLPPVMRNVVTRSSYLSAIAPTTRKG